MTTPDLEALAREHEELHAALEPAALPMASHAIGATLSIAISLKRIADALNSCNEYGEVGSEALANSIARGLRDGRQ